MSTGPRLAIVMVVTLLVFDTARDAIMEGFVLPKEVAELNRSGSGRVEVADADSPAAGTITFTGPGPEDWVQQWTTAVPEEGAVSVAFLEAELAKLKAPVGTFAWASPALHVIARGPGFGDRTLVELEVDQEVWVDYFPVRRHGEMLGWLVLQAPVEGHFVAEVGHGMPLGPPTPPDLELWSSSEQNFFRRLDQWAAVLRGLVMVAVAVVLSLIVSRWVTRRLEVLARAASSAEHPEDSMRLMVGGHDEVALLASAIDRSWQDNRQLIRDLARRDSNRRAWIARVSHDLRTPLTALVTCLDRARGRVQAMAPGEQAEELAEILRLAGHDATRVMTLAGNLLEIARLETESPLDLEPVLPAELAHRAVDVLQPLALERDLELGAEVRSGTPEVMADGHRLLRALENLLQNAVRYAHSRVRLTVEGDADAVRFSVRDDGPGFDRPAAVFQSAHERGIPVDGSAGLGLHMLRRTIEAHQGWFAAENVESGGAAVTFAVPVAGPTGKPPND